jgi:hypothetical protein
MSEEKDAPHGRNEDGTPKTPFGINLDGTPRKSNRGARPGQKGNRTAKKPGIKTGSNLTDKKRREMLVGLADMFLVTPLAGLSMSPQLTGRIGAKHTDALAGDAVILSHFSPGIADGLIVLSQSKPGALAWLDGVEDKAPYLMLAQVGVQVVKALVSNHTNPNPELAQAGRVMVAMKVQAMADQINQEAAEMGISVETPDPVQDAA